MAPDPDIGFLQHVLRERAPPADAERESEQLAGGPIIETAEGRAVTGADKS
jgi:hypothetical protein